MKNSIRTKNKLFKRAKHRNDPTSIIEFKHYRDMLTRIKMNAKNDFYREQAIRYGNNRSKIWGILDNASKRPNLAYDKRNR